MCGNPMYAQVYFFICCSVFQGLVVPVVRNVHQMNYAEIEKEIAALGQKVMHISGVLRMYMP